MSGKGKATPEKKKNVVTTAPNKAKTTPTKAVTKITSAKVAPTTTPPKKNKTTEENPNDKKRKVNDDIDDIFSKTPKASAVKEQKAPVKKRKENDIFSDSRGTNSDGRKVIDGYTVYSFDELKLDQGKDTPDCPFDCDCCF
ncbi:hypothetical protein PROFUN_08827 [Planoprotostelium fungivorum]|uniref:DUF1764-domain-containing protein n=1 Tax=Planoprotostelium fungivorum TaxID=1890364 RepID=A0A2P6MXC3_9EUKA|nr:hypothetical protein PROFUN_15298 [Planoprotostelium fungivorum]PRP83890.1 hypothetical protein PROFUN_08827 [Planoprotostelium fungivorum]